jgi:hypothetical protein
MHYQCDTWVIKINITFCSILAEYFTQVDIYFTWLFRGAYGRYVCSVDDDVWYSKHETNMRGSEMSILADLYKFPNYFFKISNFIKYSRASYHTVMTLCLCY